MSRMFGMIALVAAVCLMAEGAFAGTAPAEALDVAAETGSLTMRLKLVLAFLIMGGIAWFGHRGVAAERAVKVAPAKA